MTQRQWLSIPGFSKYNVSDDGQIVRVAGGPGSRAGLIMKARLFNGYLSNKIVG
jgi:hypothetical protein